MNDLVEFVKARLADEMQVANAAAEAFLHGDRIGIDPYKMHPSVRMHVYSWTSARVLREIEAKRRRLARFERINQLVEDDPVPSIIRNEMLSVRRALLDCIQDDAAVWSTHPAYDPSWAPDVDRLSGPRQRA